MKNLEGTLVPKKYKKDMGSNLDENFYYFQFSFVSHCHRLMARVSCDKINQKKIKIKEKSFSILQEKMKATNILIEDK